MLLFYPIPPTPLILPGGGSGWFHYCVYPILPFEILSIQRVARPSFHLLIVVWWWGGLFDYSVKPDDTTNSVNLSVYMPVCHQNLKRS